MFGERQRARVACPVLSLYLSHRLTPLGGEPLSDKTGGEMQNKQKSYTCFSASWAPGAAQPKDIRSPGGEGCPREKRTTLKRSLLSPRETGGAGKGRRAVLRFHRTHGTARR